MSVEFFDSGINDAAMAAFAEPFLLKTDNGNILLQGIFDNRVDESGLSARYGTGKNSVGFEDRIYTLEIVYSEVLVQGIALKQTVEVRDADYTIIDIQTDPTTSISTLTLRPYQ